MSRAKRSVIGKVACYVAVAATLLSSVQPALASKLVLKDGRILEGKIARLITLAPKPGAKQPANGAPPVQPIVLIDNSLVRYFVSKQQVAEADESAEGENFEHFRIRQDTPRLGGIVAKL